MTVHAEAWQHQVPPLPFELQVLEVVLGDVVALASQLARDLEAVVHPALDSLMKSVSSHTCSFIHSVLGPIMTMEPVV